MAESADAEALLHRADGERRLALLIIENKEGPELASAVTHLRNAADGYQQAGWSDRRAECLQQLGRLQLRRSQPAEAAAAFAEALGLHRAAGDTQSAIAAATGAADAHRLQGEYDQALRRAEEAVSLAEELGDHLRLASSRHAFGLVRLAREELAAAQEPVELALATYEAYKKDLERAGCHECLAQIRMGLDDPDGCREHYEVCLAIATEAGRSHDVAAALSRWADLALRHQRHDIARDVLDRCVALHRNNRNNDLLAQSLRLRGNVRQRQGDTKQALADLREALDLVRGMGDHAGEARTRYLIGSIQAKSDDPVGAIDELQLALTAAQQQGDQRIVERIYAALTRLHRQTGQHDRAIETMEEWIRVLKELGDRGEQLRVLGSLAKTHSDRGSVDEAEAYFRRLIRVCTRPIDEGEKLYAQHGLAMVLQKQERLDEAIPLLEAAVEGYTRHSREPQSTIQPPVPLARLHAQLGNCLLERKKAEEALIHFEFARHQLEMEDELGDEDQRESNRNLLARVLVGLGNAHHQLSRSHDAREFFDQAASICETQGDMRATMIIRRRTDGLG